MWIGRVWAKSWKSSAMCDRFYGQCTYRSHTHTEEAQVLPSALWRETLTFEVFQCLLGLLVCHTHMLRFSSLPRPHTHTHTLWHNFWRALHAHNIRTHTRTTPRSTSVAERPLTGNSCLRLKKAAALAITKINDNNAALVNNTNSTSTLTSIWWCFDWPFQDFQLRLRQFTLTKKFLSSVSLVRFLTQCWISILIMEIFSLHYGCTEIWVSVHKSSFRIFCSFQILSLY